MVDQRAVQRALKLVVLMAELWAEWLVDDWAALMVVALAASSVGPMAVWMVER